MHTHYEHIFPFGCEVWFVVEGTGSNESLRRRALQKRTKTPNLAKQSK
jgi:hypothetical protein